MSDTPIVVLQDARQVGKSTLAQQVSADRRAVLVTLDNGATLAAAQADPRGFVDQQPDRLLVVDEAQRLPQLVLALKASVDADRRPGRFLLTGSSDLLRVAGVDDSLAGRAETIPLMPFSQGEIAGHAEDFMAFVLAGGLEQANGATLANSRADVMAAVARGGYPELVQRTDRRRDAWIKNYIDRLTARDAQDIADVDAVNLLRVLRLIAANQAGEFVKSRLANDIGIAASTVGRYLNILEALYVAQSLSAWSGSITQRLIKRPKTYVVDSAIAR